MSDEVQGEMAGIRGTFRRWHGSLVQWKFPGIYEGGDSEDAQYWETWNINLPFLMQPGKASTGGSGLHLVNLLAYCATWRPQTTQADAST